MIPLARHRRALTDTPLRDVFVGLFYARHSGHHVSVHRSIDCAAAASTSGSVSWPELVGEDTECGGSLIGCIDCGTAGVIIDSLDDLTTRFQAHLHEFHSAASRLSQSASGVRVRETLDVTWSFAGRYPWTRDLPGTAHMAQRLTETGLIPASFLDDSAEFFADLGCQLLTQSPGMTPVDTDEPRVGVVVTGTVAIDPEAQLWQYSALNAAWTTRWTYVAFEVDTAAADLAVRVAGQWRQDQPAVVLDSAAHQALLDQGAYPAALKYAAATPDLTRQQLTDYLDALLATSV